MKHHCTILATALAAAFSASAKTFDWPIGSPAAGARQFTAYHGETVRFNLQFRGAMTNLSPVAIYYQTNGMGKAEWFEPVPGTVFHPTNDCGAASYRFFILCNDPDGKDYTANGSLRLLDSPGFEPSAVPLPVQTLDFSKVAVLNPPWPEASEPPGNYSTVSNAAMNALSRAEAEAGFTEWTLTGMPSGATNIQGPEFEDGDGGLWCHLGFTYNGVEYNSWPFVDSESVTSVEFDCSDDLDTTSYPVTATRTRLPTMADIPTKTSDLTNDSGFLTQHQQLTPVYSQTPTFTAWVVTPPDLDGVPITLTPLDYGWEPCAASPIGFPKGDTTSTHITWLAPNEADIALSATRTRTDIIGYTLGDQTNKVLASTNEIGKVGEIARAAATTNAAQAAALASHSSQLSQQSQSLNTLSSQVNAIGAHLNAEDARFVSTNYNSATHMPEAYVEVKVSNSWLTVWREMTRWDWFLGVYTNQHAALSAALATKGEREYAFYDGVTGEPAPDGFFWIAQPRVAVAGGMAYQRYVDTGGAVWVLESNGMVADLNGTTNGFFRVSDDEGTTHFEIVKGSSRTVAAAPGAMTHSAVMGVTHWFTTYAVTNASSAPVAMFCRDIRSPNWYAETDSSCPCNVSWTNPESGVYVCEWWPKSTETQMFMKAEYGQGTETRIVQSAPVEMQYIVIGGVKGTLGTAVIDGKTVLTFTP